MPSMIRGMTWCQLASRWKLYGVLQLWLEKATLCVRCCNDGWCGFLMVTSMVMMARPGYGDGKTWVVGEGDTVCKVL